MPVTSYIWFKFYIYKKYIFRIWSLALRGHVFLSAHVFGNTWPWCLKVAFHFEYLGLATSLYLGFLSISFIVWCLPVSHNCFDLISDLGQLRFKLVTDSAMLVMPFEMC